MKFETRSTLLVHARPRLHETRAPRPQWHGLLRPSLGQSSTLIKNLSSGKCSRPAMRRPAWKLACALVPCRKSALEGCLAACSGALNNACSRSCRSDLPRDGSGPTQSPRGVALHQRSRGGYPALGGYHCFSTTSASNAPAAPKSTTPTSDPSPSVPSDEVGGRATTTNTGSHTTSPRRMYRHALYGIPSYVSRQSGTCPAHAGDPE